jgi:hypothetical protein
VPTFCKALAKFCQGRGSILPRPWQDGAKAVAPNRKSLHWSGRKALAFFKKIVSLYQSKFKHLKRNEQKEREIDIHSSN